MNGASGATTGDVLVATLHLIGTSEPHPSAPTGWTAIGTGILHWSNNGRYCAYWRAADGGSDDVPTFTAGEALTSWRGVIECASGADTTDPVDTYTYFADDTNPTTHAAVTAAAADSLLILGGGSTASETGTYSYTNSVTGRYGSTSGPAIYLGTKEVGSGSTGSTDATNSSTMIRVGGISIILKPASGGYTMPVDQASYTVTAQNISLKRNALLAIGGATLTVSAQNVLLEKNSVLQLGFASYAATFSDVLLEKNSRLPLDVASVVTNWQAVGLRKNSVLPIGQASYTAAAQDVTLTLVGSGAQISVGTASYAYTPQNIGLYASRLLTIGVAAISVVGQSIRLAKSSLLTLQHASYAVGAQAIGLYANRKLTAAQASYTVTAQDIDFSVSRRLILSAATVFCVAQTIELSYSGAAGQPSYSVSYTIEYNDLPHMIYMAGPIDVTIDDGPIRAYL